MKLKALGSALLLALLVTGLIVYIVTVVANPVWAMILSLGAVLSVKLLLIYLE